MGTSEEFSIEHVPLGKAGKVALTVRCGSVAARVFKTNILDEQAREGVRAELQKAFPGFDTPDGSDALNTELLRIAAETAAFLAPRSAASGSEGGTGQDKPVAELLAAMPQDIRHEAESMLSDHDLLEHLLNDIEALGVAGERELTGTIYLIGTSRLLERPLSAIVQGPTSSGKSYIIEKVSALLPPEAVIHATQMTPQALFHMKPGRLVHKFIVAGERSHVDTDETAEATRALREMLSAGKLSKLMPIRQDGEITTVSIEQDGPIAYVESTTLNKIFEEDANRSLLLQTDERAEQTKRIIAHSAASYRGATEPGSVERIIERHHALQRLLESKQVVVPFAEQLGRLFPTDRVEARRAFPQVVSMIQAVALLHQRQRSEDEDGRLIATAEDYRRARHLLAKPMSRSLGRRLSDSAQRLCERLQHGATGKFTTRDVIQREKATGRAIRGWLSEMHDAGVLEQAEPSRGNIPAKWRWGKVSLEEIDNDCPDLPTVDSVFPERDFHRSGKAQDTFQKTVAPETPVVAG